MFKKIGSLAIMLLMCIAMFSFDACAENADTNTLSKTPQEQLMEIKASLEEYCSENNLTNKGIGCRGVYYLADETGNVKYWAYPNARTGQIELYENP